MAQKLLWRCTICRRKFAKHNQAHSCQAVSVDVHFEGKPSWLKELYHDLARKLKEFGPVRSDAVKSSINLVSKHHFGGIHVLRDGLRLGFILSHPIEHARILRIERITPTIYAHHVKITRTEDLDAELLAWLKEAYDRSA